MPKSRSGLYGYDRNSVPTEYDSQEGTYGGWQEAFRQGDDWEAFVDRFGHNISDEDTRAMMRQWDDNGMFGYVRTANSFDINQALYSAANEGKTDEEIFTRVDSKGRLRDLQTVQALDRTIASGRTQANAVYTRYCDYGAIKSTFGLSDSQMQVLKRAWAMNPSQLSDLNAAMKGSMSFSKSYTSSSGNRRLNVFQSKPIERKLYIPKGTNAYAVKQNAHESEVIFGRRMQTQLMGITISDDGHIVLHEKFVGYRKR